MRVEELNSVKEENTKQKKHKKRKKETTEVASVNSPSQESKFKKKVDTFHEEKPVSRKISSNSKLAARMEKKKQLEVSIIKIHEENLKKTKKGLRMKKKVAKQLEEDGRRREKKIYKLPGQKRDPPDKRDPLRIFYETLYHQVATSELAEDLLFKDMMMESGLLPEEEAMKILQKKQKTNQSQDLLSSTKAILVAKQSTKSIRSNTKHVSSSDTLKKKAKKKTISSSQTDKGKKRKRDTGLVEGSSSL